jgi:hypothetical protein
MQAHIRYDDMSALMALVHEAGVNTLLNEFRIDAEGNVTYPDAIADKVRSILAQPDWPTRGNRRLLKNYVDEVRRKFVARGVVVDGNFLATDPPERMTELLMLEHGSGNQVALRDANGKPVNLTKDQLTKLLAAVADYIQRCNRAEQKLSQRIDRDQVTSTKQVDAEFAKELG